MGLCWFKIRGVHGPAISGRTTPFVSVFLGSRKGFSTFDIHLVHVTYGQHRAREMGESCGIWGRSALTNETFWDRMIWSACQPSSLSWDNVLTGAAE